MNNILDPQGFLRGQVRCHGTQLSIANRIYPLNTEPFTYTLPHHPTLLLDPGHVGGKYDDLRKITTNRGDVIQEGNLTLKTAQYLQALLQKNNIKTFFTRNELAPVTEVTLDEIEDDPQIPIELLKSTLVAKGYSDSQLRRIKRWNRVDLEARAILINQSPCDFAISIHYSGDIYSPTTTANGFFVTLPGNYSKAQLDDPTIQSRCIEHALNGNLLLSHQFANHLVNCFKQHLKLSPVPHTILKNEGFHCVQEGIYSAPLILPDLVMKPFILVDGPYQNNVDELNRSETERIQRYGNALFASISQWFKK